jgi:hypothetical protein
MNDMNQPKYARALGALLGLCAAGAARAQSLTIDDFATGPVAIAVTGAKQTTDFVKLTTQKGSGIVGGVRATQLAVPLAGNIFGQNAFLQIKPATAVAPAGLFFGGGFQVDNRLDMSYGYSENPKKLLHNVNLTPYDRIRLTFSGVNGTVDFVFEIWSNIGGTFTGEDWNCDLAPSTQSNWPATEFTVDLPFNEVSGPVDFTDVKSLYVVLESAGQGGQGYGLEKIEAVSGGTADMVCSGLSGARHGKVRHTAPFG